MTAEVLTDPESASSWPTRHLALSQAWQQLLAAERARDRQAVPAWRATAQQMAARQAQLLGLGRWRSGPATLLAAIDVQDRELALTAGLAWLLRPDGHHGLGDALLLRLLQQAGLDAPAVDASVRVVLEEQRGKTRADLVVYGKDWTLVVEAKTFAIEQPQQLDRLHQHWQHERGVRFLFLTRGRRSAVSDVVSNGSWELVSWADVARLSRAAAASRGDVAAGVYEYIATLEAYHRG